MGIRFYCPNGCKVHVKAFQAGRRGICPHCGAGVDIPLESTRGPSKRKNANSAPRSTQSGASGHGTTKPGRELANDSALDGDEEIELAISRPAALGTTPPGGLGTLDSPPPMPPSVLPDALPPVPPFDMPPPVPASPQLEATAIASKKSDPIEEVPDAIWYVRPPMGGQYGPATGDVLRGWLGEGRITPDSQLWREGWRDWKGAAEVFSQDAFPQLRLADGLMDLDRILESAGPVLGTPLGSHHAPIRRRSVWRQGIVVAVLVALGAVALAAVYLWARYL